MKINTIDGEMDADLLEKREGVVDNDNERTEWVEYWKEDVLMHRSVHVTLKKMPALFAQVGEVG